MSETKRQRVASEPTRVTGSVDVIVHVRNGLIPARERAAFPRTSASGIAALQHRQLAEVLRDELECGLIGTDVVLGLALDATRHDFVQWDGWARQAGFADEFSVTADDLEVLPDAFRLAYLGRLLRMLEAEVGLGGEQEPGQTDSRLTPAAVVRLLCGITRSPDLATSSTGEEINLALIEGTALGREDQ